jgi:DNA-binding MarR family transcriptional regulator
MDPVTTPCVCTTLRMTARAILSRVNAEGPFTIGELADRLAMERSTCSRELAPLTEQGLIELSEGTDRRQRVIAITRRGKRRLQEARPMWETAQEQIAREFGQLETERLLTSLRQLRRGAQLQRDVVEAGR